LGDLLIWYAITRLRDYSISRFSTAAALVACTLAAGCTRVPPPPYERAFAADVRSPRILETSREIVVPLGVTNLGQRAWDPARIHVSYHWLWLVPRELLRRSRTVPYHDGIRTDLGDRPVASGERRAVQGRLLPPPLPGIYWLQWDMVEEGVAWFAQVAPRQPRTIVVVLPPPAWLFAPLPLLAALGGLVALGRRRNRVRAGAFAAIPDVIWCATALATKPLILAHEALLEPTAVSYWLVVAVALIVPVVGLLMLPRRLRPWVLLAAGIFGSLLILGDVVYFRFFGDVLSTPALLAARQTGRVWGSIGTLFTPGLAWLVIDWPFACWLAVRLSRRPEDGLSLRGRMLTAAATLAAVVTAGAALSAPAALASTPLAQMFRARSVVEQLGPFGYHAYDVWNYMSATRLRPPVTDAQLRDALAWLLDRAPLREGPRAEGFGAASGRNLIVVQVESLQDFAVDFRVNDQDVMPHLRQWAGDSLRFTNVTDQTGEGRTSDAEFTTMTSLLPLDHGAVAFRFPGNHYVALPRVLTEHGYTTLSAVAFEPGFWNRQVMHPAYGFQTSLFEPDFQLTEQIGWGLNDRDFLQQMMPRLERLPRPFAAWLITLSLHHPFDAFPDRHKVLKLGTLEGTSFGNYLHTMRFFDQALEDFTSALARSGLLDDSLLVVFGDHDAGFARDRGLADTIGIGADEAVWALNDRVPLFIRVHSANSASGGLIGARSVPAGQTDLAPTLLALLGIDAAPLPYLGRNLLNLSGTSGDVPVPRPYGDWLDASHLFLSRGPASECYDVARHVAAPPADCSRADATAVRARALSHFVVVDDLQQRLRALLAAAIK
jgi:phosphoglycerol transferase MdoB-like AlkP superfamily enzyme